MPATMRAIFPSRSPHAGSNATAAALKRIGAEPGTVCANAGTQMIATNRTNQILWNMRNNATTMAIHQRISGRGGIKRAVSHPWGSTPLSSVATGCVKHDLYKVQGEARIGCQYQLPRT